MTARQDGHRPVAIASSVPSIGERQWGQGMSGAFPQPENNFGPDRASRTNTGAITMGKIAIFAAAVHDRACGPHRLIA